MLFSGRMIFGLLEHISVKVSQCSVQGLNGSGMARSKDNLTALSTCEQANEQIDKSADGTFQQ